MNLLFKLHIWHTSHRPPCTYIKPRCKRCNTRYYDACPCRCRIKSRWRTL